MQMSTKVKAECKQATKSLFCNNYNYFSNYYFSHPFSSFNPQKLIFDCGVTLFLKNDASQRFFGQFLRTPSENLSYLYRLCM